MNFNFFSFFFFLVFQLFQLLFQVVQINLSPEIAVPMFVPGCNKFLFMVALEVVEVAAEMTFVQVQMLVVLVVGFDDVRKKNLQVWLLVVMVVVEMAVVGVMLVKKNGCYYYNCHCYYHFWACLSHDLISKSLTLVVLCNILLKILFFSISNSQTKEPITGFYASEVEISF